MIKKLKQSIAEKLLLVFVVTLAVIFHGIGARKKRMPVTT